eukprot:CAMPEP_0168503332 /NCGR_PEP_ID=MMETSP0228-20121227/75805_1 /TAXON_ID=133427 /ORGANISM="Protoceratium reticulatum, Strain CCCM 535 (=CCMP 1889)" /LENGTH=550 /DNA_ID=CAMNT_0008520393 /DNA_START=29 /DNA_END=1678 /DNA_ORIENTATION=+
MASSGEAVLPLGPVQPARPAALVRPQKGTPAEGAAAVPLVPVLAATTAAALVREAPRRAEVEPPEVPSLSRPPEGSTRASPTCDTAVRAGAAQAAEDEPLPGNEGREGSGRENGVRPSPRTEPTHGDAAGAQCDHIDEMQAEAPAPVVTDAVTKRVHIFVTSPPGIGKTTMVQKLLAMLKAEDGEDVEVVGFYTEEMRDETGQRCGFDVVRVGGGPADAPSRSALARLGQAQPRVGKYSVDVNAFEAFALPALEPQPRRERRLYTAPDGAEEAVALLEEGEGGEPCRVLLAGRELRVEASQLQSLPECWQGPGAQGDLCPRLVVCDEVGKMELLSLRFPAAFTATLDGEAMVLGTLPQPARGQRDHELVERVRARPDVRVVRLTRSNRDQALAQVYGQQVARPGPARHGAAGPAGGRRGAGGQGAGAGREEGAAGGAGAGAAAKAKELARKRQVLAKQAREQRKARALVRKKAKDMASSGVVMAVVDDGSSDSLECDEPVEDLDDLEDTGDVEDVDAVVDVESRRAAARRAQRPVALVAPVPVRPRPALR